MLAPPKIPLPFPPPETKRDLAALDSNERALSALEMTKPASVRVPAPEAQAIDFDMFPALTELPEAAREVLMQSASMVALARGEEVPASALALVLAGEVTVSASVVDAAAMLLRKGDLVRSRGTIDAHLSIRLIAGSDDVRVACWTEETVERAFESAPAVENQLLIRGNRVQAICGATIGPLGERLDTALLHSVTERLEARAFNSNATVVEQGVQPGLILVGAGEVIVEGGAVFTSGDFVFPELILGGGKAPHRVRAGEGGAVLLCGDRVIAQELLATSPSLVEILAGM
jgi:hypothetical protein